MEPSADFIKNIPLYATQSFATLSFLFYEKVDSQEISHPPGHHVVHEGQSSAHEKSVGALEENHCMCSVHALSLSLSVTMEPPIFTPSPPQPGHVSFLGHNMLAPQGEDTRKESQEG